MLKLIKQFLKYIRTVKRYIVGGLIMMVLTSIFAGANIGMIYPFFDGVFLRPAAELQSANAPQLEKYTLGASLSKAYSDVRSDLESAESPGTLREVFSQRFAEFIERHSRLDVLLMLCVMAIVLASAKIITLYIYRISFIHIEQTLIRELRNDLFRHIQTLSLDFLQRFRPGEVISRVMNDVMVVRSLTITKIADLALNLLQGLVYFSIALYIDWRMTLISALVLAPAVASFQMIGQRLRKYSKRAQEKISLVTDRLSENIQGFRVVQVFFSRKREMDRFNASTFAYFKRARKLEFVGALSVPFGEFASTLVAVFMLWYGGSRVLAAESSMTGAAFLTFLAALLSMLHPLKVVAKRWNELQKGTGAGDRILEIFEQKSSIVESTSPVPLNGFKNSIKFENVSYNFGDKQVLSDINLSLKQGEFLAIVGASGSGKTTLANLLLRLLDPVSGSVLLDNQNIKDFPLGDYRRLFGVVSQDTWLFEMNVAENIAYPDVDPPNHLVEKALATANATSFVDEMGGVESLVKEGGSNLSGGQKQRLAIARAVSHIPEILVFDEATSALDTESEKLVQSALSQSVGNRTALVIAHRLSTIISADRIICLKDGRIEGLGPHAELLEKSAEYRKLYELQFQV
jgi:ATP-binding cassette, subfamily B, bacterial MsbA